MMNPFVCSRGSNLRSQHEEIPPQKFHELTQENNLVFRAKCQPEDELHWQVLLSWNNQGGNNIQNP